MHFTGDVRRLQKIERDPLLFMAPEYLCQEGLVSEKTVLHLGTGMDHFAGNALLKAMPECDRL